MSKITLYYAEWCGHCQTFKPVWKNLKKDLDKNNIEYKEYEHSKNSNEISNANIQGFPTIRITRNNKTYDYEGPRTKKDILKEFGILSQSGGQRDNCDDDHRKNQKFNYGEYSDDPSYYGIRQGNRNKQSGGQKDNCDDDNHNLNKDNCDDDHRKTQKFNYGIRQDNRNEQSGGGNMYYKKYLKYKAKYMKAKRKL